jgi:hypothetical protein
MKQFLLFSFCLCWFSAFAQDKNLNARNDIELLKNGTLLVRLKSGEMQAKALENGGDKTAADAYRKKQADENLAIIKAFRAKYTFSPVLFFFSSSSEQVRQKNFHNCFLNDQLLPDSTITGPANRFLVAEMGFSTQQHFEGIILMDDQLVQLSPPFPWIVKKYGGGIKSRTNDEMVKQLEENLWDFYRKK